MPQCKAEYKTPDGIVYCVQEEGHEGKHRAENGGTWAGWSNDEYADLRAEVKRLIKLFEQLCYDTSDGMDCLPECDSVAHAEECPLTNPVVAWRKLRQRIADLERELEQMRQERDEAPRGCRASSGDGECIWKHCPQLRDGEPEKTGRHCPLDIAFPWDYD